MKLTIENIKAYPWGKQGVRVIADDDGVERWINGLYENGNVQLVPSSGTQEHWEVSRLKLLLYPIDEVTEEKINVHGHKFIPLGKLHYQQARTPGGKTSKAQYETIIVEEYIGTRPKNSILLGVGIHTFNMGHTRHSVVRQLEKWLFDTKDLINKGVAEAIKS